MSLISGGTFSSSRYGFLSRVLVMACATLLAAWLLPGVTVGGIGAAILTALVIAVLDNVVRPILLVITLPMSVMTLGLFIFVINTAIVMMANGLLGDKFVVAGWGSGLLFSLVLTCIDYLVELPARRRQQALDNAHHDDDPDDEEYTPYEEVQD